MALSARTAAALIVEDQPFAGMVASDILRETGFETFHAFDAADAMSLLSAHPEIEVVVTNADLSGPIDGLELTRRLSAERPGVQLIVTAAATDVGGSSLPAGARVLRKPYASSELRALVAGMALLQEA